LLLLQGGVKALAAVQGQLLSGAFDTTIRVWNRRTGQCDDVLVGHTSGVTALSVYDGGRKFASTSSDDSVRLWAIQPMAAAATAAAGAGARGPSSSPPPPTTATAAGKWVCLARLTGHDCTVWAICSFGRWLLSGDEHGMLKVWDTTTGRCEGTGRQSERSAEPIATVAVTVDGDIISTSWDGSIAFWNWSKAEPSPPPPLANQWTLKQQPQLQPQQQPRNISAAAF
jgi:WD40 repeat protein